MAGRTSLSGKAVFKDLINPEHRKTVCGVSGFMRFGKIK